MNIHNSNFIILLEYDHSDPDPDGDNDSEIEKIMTKMRKGQKITTKILTL